MMMLHGFEIVCIGTDAVLDSGHAQLYVTSHLEKVCHGGYLRLHWRWAPVSLCAEPQAWLKWGRERLATVSMDAAIRLHIVDTEQLRQHRNYSH